MNGYINYVSAVVVILTVIVEIVRARQAGKNLVQVAAILVNTLKDEVKMHNGAFKPETLQKLDAVADIMNADKSAVEAAKEALRGKEIKLGSYKGKPVFLSDALKLGGVAEAVQKVFK